MLLRRLKKSRSLRLVNLLGLAVIFACLLLSHAYLRTEYSYDRHYPNSERIARLSLQFADEPTDVRIYDFVPDDPLIAGVPAIAAATSIVKIEGSELHSDGRIMLPAHFYAVDDHFLDVFALPIVEGDRNTALNSSGKAIVSRSYARQLFGDEPALGRELQLTNGRKFADQKLFISGVFEDIPAQSHFHSDLFIYNGNRHGGLFAYIYLLLQPDADFRAVHRAIADNLKRLNADNPRTPEPLLMPLTDIHLHSHLLREHEPNGHIYYIYLTVGANLLLLLIVMFNLWLNAGLIFSFNQRFYQLLRLNGASGLRVVADECILAVVSGLAAIAAGVALAHRVSPELLRTAAEAWPETAALGAGFLLLTVAVSLLPVVVQLPSTLLTGMQTTLQRRQFSLSRVKYLLIGQYAIVMFAAITGFGISRQIELIRHSQVGGDSDSMLVLREQPSSVTQRYHLLKTELLKHPEIEAVTTSMQLPGDAIRDGVLVRRADEGDDDARRISVLVVGEDFLPFFDIGLAAGRSFAPLTRSTEDELSLMQAAIDDSRDTNATEEYVINMQAMRQLGFKSAQEAIGQSLHIRHGKGGVDYIGQGTIVGVTEDFNYTTAFEASAPQLLLQRRLYQFCLMVAFDPARKEEAMEVFNRVWDEVYPGYPARYSFLHDVYAGIYRNELHAERLTHLFAALCLLIATLGLIIVMAFVVKRKTKEIGIRKINGATPFDIVRMLNWQMLLWTVIAFALATPGAYAVMSRWLTAFAIKTSLEWWLFAAAGLFVLAVSAAAVSWQSWRAATINPVKTLKIE